MNAAPQDTASDSIASNGIAPNRFATIGVIGAGAWGSALANALVRAGRDVMLWTRSEQTANALAQTRKVPHLPGIALEGAVRVTSDIAQAANADALLLVVPAQSLRDVARQLSPHIARGTPIVACAKGIERGTRKFMTQIIGEEIAQARRAILSGPSFASDVARGLPTAVTLAAQDEPLAIALTNALGSATFRPYHATDIRGVEIGGAAKNVLAIAAGIVIGRELGASALAALITRGFAELSRFGQALGAKAETLSGLSGLGDLILTCSSPQSRNFTYGMRLGRGEGAAHGALTEGHFTASVLSDMAREHEIDMPIAHMVHEILEQRLRIDDAIGALLHRPFRAEN